MKTSEIFVAILWFLLGAYLVSLCMDLMNMKSTLAFVGGILGIVLILFLSCKTELGTTFLTKSTKPNKNEDEK